MAIGTLPETINEAKPNLVDGAEKNTNIDERIDNNQKKIRPLSLLCILFNINFLMIIGTNIIAINKEDHNIFPRKYLFINHFGNHSIISISKITSGGK
jgi:hypothetical protein